MLTSGKATNRPRAMCKAGTSPHLAAVRRRKHRPPAAAAGRNREESHYRRSAMIVIGEYHARNASDLEPGELICFDLGRGRIYGIRGTFGRSEPSIVVLQSEEPGFRGSYMLDPGTIHRCLSFGLNWVLEPLLGTELPPGEGCRIPGTLVIHNQDIQVITKIRPGNIRPMRPGSALVPLPPPHAKLARVPGANRSHPSPSRRTSCDPVPM